MSLVTPSGGGGVTPPQVIDGIYFDPVAGVPGISDDIGIPNNPVNNLADAISLFALRKTNKLVLSGAQAFGGAQTGPNNPTVMTDIAHFFTPNSLIGLMIHNGTTGNDAVIIANTIHTVTVAAIVGGWTTGDTYSITTVTGDNPYMLVIDQSIVLEIVGSYLYFVIADGGVNVTINSDLVCQGLFNFNGTLSIMGSIFSASDIGNDNGGTLNIGENAHISGQILNSNIASSMSIGGDCYLAGGIDNGDGDLAINGNCTSINGFFNSTGIIGINGNVFANGSNGIIENTGTGSVTIHGNCQVAQYIINSGGGQIIIEGKLDISSDPAVGAGFLDNTGGGDIFIGNDCYVSWKIVNSTAHLYIQGDCTIGGIHAAHGTLELTGTGQIYIQGNCEADAVDVTGGGGCFLTINGGLQVKGTGGLNIAAASNVYIGGDTHLPGSLTNAGTLQIDGHLFANDITNSGGAIDVFGDCHLAAQFTNSGGGPININGKLDVCGNPTLGSGFLDNTDGGDIVIGNDCHLAGELTNTTAMVKIFGNITLGFGSLINNGLGVVFVDGNLQSQGGISNNDVGAVDISGTCNCNGLANISTGRILIKGDVYTGAIANTFGGQVDLKGNVFCEAIDNGDAASVLTIIGKTFTGVINNTGTLTIGPVEVQGSISNIGALDITINGNCQVGTNFINSGGGKIDIYGKLDINGNGDDGDGNLNNIGGGVVLINGDVNITGEIMTDLSPISIEGNCKVTVITISGLISVDILGDCQVAASVTNSGGGDFTVYGNCQVGGSILNSGSITITGSLYSTSIDNTGGGSLSAGGDCIIGNNYTADTGLINVGGRFEINAVSPAIFQIGNNLLSCGSMKISGSLQSTVGGAGLLCIGDAELFWDIIVDGGSVVIGGNLMCRSPQFSNCTVNISGDTHLYSLTIDNSTANFKGNVFITTDYADDAATTTTMGGIARINGTIFKLGILTYAVLNPEETQYQHTHAAQHVAPELAVGVTVAAGVGAYTLGAFSANIIAPGGDASAGTQQYDIHGIDIENPSANASYEVKLYGTLNGVADTLLGSATFTRTNATTVSRSTTMQTPKVDVGSGIRAKLASSSGAADTCVVKIWYHNYD